MASELLWLSWLHLAASMALLLAASARLVRPGAASSQRWQEVAAAILVAAALPLAGESGWWIDMPGRRMVPILIGLAIVLALVGTARLPGRLAALALAAFFLTLGIASIRNAGPLAGFMAAKSILTGAVVALLVPDRGARARAALTLLLAGSAAGLGHLQDLPLP